MSESDPEKGPPPDHQQREGPPEPGRMRAEGKEPSSGPTSSSPNSSGTPPWVVWSRGLNALLDDPQGQDLFKSYLEDEGCNMQLTFLWACEGLKFTAATDASKIQELTKKIYRFFIPNLIGLSEKTKEDLAEAILEERFSEIEIFHRAENEVLSHMRENLYPNFLKSEIYLSACNGEEVASSSSGSGRERRQSEGEESNQSLGEEEEEKSTLPPDGESKSQYHHCQSFPPEKTQPQQPSSLATSQLQTVHEDKELSMLGAASVTHSKPKKQHLGLTREALLATEFQRATESQVEGARVVKASSSSAGRFSGKGSTSSSSQIPFPYHASYSSYNPVSRVDSEVQSMSSGAMTDDGSTGGGRRRHGHPERRHEDRSSSHSHRQHQHRGGGEQAAAMSHNHSSSASNDARIRRDFRLDPSVTINVVSSLPSAPPPAGKVVQGVMLDKKRNGPDPEKDTVGFANLLKEKLQNELAKRANLEKNQLNRDILAQAISKLQSQEEESPHDILDNHFVSVPYFADVTPKSKSPKLRSPTVGRRKPLPPPPAAFPGPPLPPARRRDFVQSTFSIDSGNVPDSDAESRVMPKSRSVPHELRSPMDRRPPPQPPTGANPRGYHHPHPPRGYGGKIPSMFKKPTSMEFLDSGISTVSGPSVRLGFEGYRPVGAPDAPFTENRFQDWRFSARSGHEMVGIPIDFPRNPVGSSSQKKLRKPNPPELEDVREKLAQTLELHTSGRHAPSAAAPPRVSPPTSDSSDATVVNPVVRGESNCVNTVVIYDDNKDVPYLLKIPKLPDKYGSGVTLRSLKERLPRQGAFRYFFRTECPELGRFVQEEILDETQELPMMNGKIFAHLKADHVQAECHRLSKV